MNKLATILHGHANWAHRWDKQNPTTYIYGSGGAVDTVATKELIKALFLELTDPEYQQAFNTGDRKTYELLVSVRKRILEQ